MKQWQKTHKKDVQNHEPVIRFRQFKLVEVHPGSSHTHTKGNTQFPNRQTGTYFTPCSSASIVNFEQVNAGWVSVNTLIPTSPLSNSHYF